MTHQVMNDVQTELRDADEAQDRTAFLAGEQEWQRDARAFLLNQGGDAQAPPPKKIALRKSARAWCVAVDKQLRNALGDGLARFRLAASIRDRGAAESWPVLSMRIDPGSDGWTAAMYLCRHNTNMVIMFDPSPRAWNDAKSGLQSSKLWGAAVLLQVTMNLDHGPWRDGRWHAEIVEAAGVYSKFGSPEDCAILQSLLEPIVRDTGDFDMLADPLVARNISAALPDYFQDLQPKVSMTRCSAWWMRRMPTSHGGTGACWCSCVCVCKQASLRLVVRARRPQGMGWSRCHVSANGTGARWEGRAPAA